MKNPLLPLLLLLVAAIAVGDRFLPYGPFRTAPQWPAEAVTRQGVVTQPPRESGSVVRMVLRLTESGQLVQLTALQDTAASPSSAPQVGDLVAFHTRLTPPRNAGNPGEVDYASHLRHQGITGQGFCLVSDWRSLGPASSLTLSERMLTLRSRVVGLYAQHFEGEALALVSAMTLGDRSRVDHSLRELYNRTGASHILALSGLHLGILCGLLLLFVARPLRRWGRVAKLLGAVLVLLLLWAFVLFAGMPVSLVRAATMFSVFLVLQQLHRSPPPFHTLILTLLVMLLWSPVQLFDVGFQLSAVAVAAILALGWVRERLSLTTSRGLLLSLRLLPWRVRFENAFPRLALLVHRPWVLTFLKSLLTLFLVSILAQLATLPLTAHYFGRISPSGFISSLVVIPMAYCVLFGALLFLVLVPLRAFLAALISALLRLAHSLLDSMAALPFSSFDVELSWWGVAGAYALMGWLVYNLGFRRLLTTQIERPRLVRAHLFRTLAVALLIVVGTIAAEQAQSLMQRPDTHIAIYNRTDRTEIHLVTPATDSLLTPTSPHLVGRVLLFAQQSVAIVREPLPILYGIELPPPLHVDVLLLGRGAKGHLPNILQRYRPQLVALDGSLTDYYRRRFAAEAALLGLPLYDISEQGALLLQKPKESPKDP